MKKISIAIPTYEFNERGAEFLDDLLRTIEIQKFKDFEVVISDHSQDDGLISTIKEFENKFDIIYFKNNDKRGNSPANLNTAIDKCSGEIIKIMFQDDFFYDDEALDRIYYTLIDSNKMWLLNGTNHTSDHGHSFYWDLFPTFNDDLLKGVNTISSPTVVSFKRECDIRFDENLIYFMDLDFYYSMREKYGEPIYYNDILVSNRVHLDSISSGILNRKQLMIQETKYCLEKHNIEK